MAILVIKLLVSFFAVAGGLFALWSFMSILDTRQRALYAVVAGAFSVAITLIVILIERT